MPRNKGKKGKKGSRKGLRSGKNGQPDPDPPDSSESDNDRVEVDSGSIRQSSRSSHSRRSQETIRENTDNKSVALSRGSSQRSKCSDSEAAVAMRKKNIASLRIRKEGVKKKIFIATLQAEKFASKPGMEQQTNVLNGKVVEYEIELVEVTSLLDQEKCELRFEKDLAKARRLSMLVEDGEFAGESESASGSSSDGDFMSGTFALPKKLSAKEKEKGINDWAANSSQLKPLSSSQDCKESGESTSHQNPSSVPQNEVSQLVAAMTSAFQAACASTANPQKLDTLITRQVQGRVWLPQFHGKSTEEWVDFITAWNSSLELGPWTPELHILRLRKAIQGEARSAIRPLLEKKENWEIIIQKLEEYYGEGGIVLEQMIIDAEKLPAVVEKNPSTWIELGHAVQNLVAHMQTLQQHEQLSNPTLVRKLAEKLPDLIRFDWEKSKRELLQCPENKGKCASLIMFADWLKPYLLTAYSMRKVNANKKGDDEKKGGSRTKKNFQKKEKENVMTANSTSSSSQNTPSTSKASNAKPEKSNTPWEKKDCTWCGTKDHRPWDCSKFNDADKDQRWTLVKSKSACFGCLYSDHGLKDCKTKRPCNLDGCDQFHNRKLHRTKKKAQTNDKKDKEVVKHCEDAADGSGSESEFAGKVNSNGTETNFHQFPVFAKCDDGSLKKVMLVLDSFASITATSEEEFDRLGIKGVQKRLEVDGFQESSVISNSRSADIKIISMLDGREAILKNVRSVPQLKLPKQSVRSEVLQGYKHLKGLPIKTYSNEAPQILVGFDNFELHIPEECRKGKAGEPAAIRTNMGWALVGLIGESKPFVFHINEKVKVLDDFHQTVRGQMAGRDAKVNSGCESAFLSQEKLEDPLHQLVKGFFTTEFFGIQPTRENTRNKDDKRGQEILDLTLKRVGERWQCGLLWRHDEVILPSSKKLAMQRLLSLEKKGERNKTFASQYDQKLMELVANKYARKLSPAEAAVETSKTFYLPHFNVTNPKKPEKFRIVFDYAARVGGKSLNDFLLPGPDKLVSLPGTLIKFHERRVAVCADVKDMFFQVKLSESDSQAQRFLWRNGDTCREPDVYEMTSVSFGATCSPTCVAEAKNKNALEFVEEFPKASTAIVEKTYQDDYLNSFDTDQEAIQNQIEVTEIYRRGSFSMCNWLSNSDRVIKCIPENLRGHKMKSIVCDGESVYTERVLGMFWMPESDFFTFSLQHLKVKSDVISGVRVPTKRELLALVMSIYDPLGLIAILTVKAKIILQSTWRSKIDWDDDLPSTLHKHWEDWRKLLLSIPTFSIPRCYSSTFSTATEIQLHLFGDSSEDAFGVSAYYRIKKGSKIETILIMGKSNVTPIKPLSIPKNELQAAVMAARLGTFIKENQDIKIDKTVYWTDSMSVLKWIQSDGKNYKQFVAVRIGEIQELTDPVQWKYVPSKQNPADLLTRIDSPCDWSPQSFWLRGPSFLQAEETTWPISPADASTEEEDEKKEKVFKVVQSVNIKSKSVIEFSRFSSYVRLLNATAYVLRFVEYIKGKKKIPVKTGPIAVCEVEKARLWVVRLVQVESFHKEIKLVKCGKLLNKDKTSALYNLNVLYEDGLLRVGGRLEKADIPSFTKNPLILPSNHHFTKLLAHYFHQKMGHHGRESIANEVRQGYFIKGLRGLVKAVQLTCQTCKNKSTKPKPPMMGQLPKGRVQAFCPVFFRTGLDYFGPLEVVVKRSKEKRYVALFTCLSTRALHLELCSSLSADSCILAIERFSCIRGKPGEIWSDNGKNLVGSNNELQKALQDMDQQQMQSKCANMGIKFRFIPPLSPHFGGAWERLVRAVKVAMKETVKVKTHHEEVLRTVLCEAMHIVNSHPLTYVSVDPVDPEALTPNHFLMGHSSNSQSWGDFSIHDLHGRKQWRAVQALMDVFWRRWVKEYLPTLLRRQKWCTPTTPIKEGDIVVEVNPNLPRGQWPLGRVIKLYPGEDGVVRVVDVMASNHHIYKRAVRNLGILDTDPERSQDKQPQQQAVSSNNDHDDDRHNSK